MKNDTTQVDPSNEGGHQEDLFSIVGPLNRAGVTVHEAEPEDHVLVVRDPLFTHDVPLAADEHVRKIPVHLITKDGTRRQEIKDGKVLYRFAPHPDWVSVGDQIMQREKAEALGLEDEMRSMMVPTITTILYERGVLQPDHLDVFYCLTNRMGENFARTGRADGKIQITKSEIAKMLSIGESEGETTGPGARSALGKYNGRLASTVDDALETLSGLRVIKTYPAPGPGKPGHGIIPEVSKQMGAWVVNANIERFSGLSGSSGGRRPDVITVDLNPAFVRCLSGDREDRNFLTRPFNLKQNLKHIIHWKRHLNRVLDGRLDVSGKFQMPFEELWLDVLGRPPRDFETAPPNATAEEREVYASRLRKARYKMLTTLKQWEATGYLINADIVMRDRGPTTSLERSGGETVITVDDEQFTVPGRRDAGRASDSGVVAWVVAEEGPNYKAGKPPMLKPAFAIKILAATNTSERQGELLLKQCGLDFVVDVGYNRLKHLCTLMGDRVSRLPLEKWLSEAYPVPGRFEIVRALVQEHYVRVGHAALGRGALKTVSADHEARRLRVLNAWRERLMGELNLAHFVDPSVKAKGPRGPEVVACFRIALDRLIKEEGVSRDVLNEEERARKPELTKAFKELIDLAGDVAWRAASQMLWFEDLDERCVKKLGTFGDEWTRDTRMAIIRLLPEPWGIVLEMLGSSRKPWEQHVGRLFQRRIGERWVEGERLRELDPRGEPDAKA